MHMSNACLREMRFRKFHKLKESKFWSVKLALTVAYLFNLKDYSAKRKFRHVF